jgi:hypothetical protein
VLIDKIIVAVSVAGAFYAGTLAAPASAPTPITAVAKPAAEALICWKTIDTPKRIRRRKT